MCASSWQKKHITSLHPQLFTQFRATKPLRANIRLVERGRNLHAEVERVGQAEPLALGQSPRRLVINNSVAMNCRRSASPIS
jgi:hypothetical protein